MAVIVIVPIFVASRVPRTGSIVQGGGIPRLCNIIFVFLLFFQFDFMTFLLLNTCPCQSSISWLPKIAILFSHPIDSHTTLINSSKYFIEICIFDFSIWPRIWHGIISIFSHSLYSCTYITDRRSLCGNSLHMTTQTYDYNYNASINATSFCSMSICVSMCVCVCVHVCPIRIPHKLCAMPSYFLLFLLLL